MSIKLYMGAALVAALMGFGSAANAATCPSPTIVGDGVVTLGGAAAGASCYAYGTPPTNIDGSANDPMVAAGYTLLANLGAAGTDGLLTITNPTTGQGSFTITATSLWTDFIVAIKDGNLGGLQWGAFLLVAGDLTGTWALQDSSGKYKGLSDFSLYAMACPEGGCPAGGPGPSPTPLPGAVWLFGTIVAGWAGFKKLTKRRELSLAAA
jgi:hypothetical protein